MNFIRLSLLAILILLFSCKKDQEPDPVEQVPVAVLDSLSKAKINTNLLTLSAAAEKDLETFEDFRNLRSFMKSLRDFNPYYIDKHIDSLAFLIQTFEENLSKDLNVKPVASRITVLNTELGLLKLNFEVKNPDTQKILDANTRMVKAYNSLIIQLNELSLAIPENIEKELLRDFEKEEE